MEAEINPLLVRRQGEGVVAVDAVARRAAAVMRNVEPLVPIRKERLRFVLRDTVTCTPLRFLAIRYLIALAAAHAC